MLTNIVSHSRLITSNEHNALCLACYIMKSPYKQTDCRQAMPACIATLIARQLSLAIQHLNTNCKTVYIQLNIFANHRIMQ
jgi:hypothetical protein